MTIDERPLVSYHPAPEPVKGKVLLGALVLASVITGAAAIIPMLTGLSYGEMIAQSEGKVIFERFDEISAVPATHVPAWMPEDATAVTVKTPGETAGFTDGL